MLILYIFLVSETNNCWFRFVSTAPTYRDIFLLVLFKEIFYAFISAFFELLITLVEDVCIRVKLLQSCLTVTLWSVPTRLLCPGDSLGKNTEVGCHAWIFRIQGLNPCLLCLLLWQVGSLPLAPPGKRFIEDERESESEVAQSCLQPHGL